jgi:phage terminase large subunit
LDQVCRAILQRRLSLVRPPETDADRLRHYRNDPVRFAQEILGLRLSKKQAQILNAIRDHKRVSVRSGRRVGKSYVFAAAALWFYCTQGPDARVVLMATTDRQVKGIMWRAIEMLWARAKIKLPGVKGDSHESGCVWGEMFCEIKGYTARDAEAIAGIAGARLMYLIDEASGVKQQIFDAVEGNLAGGNAWLCLISNPTRNDGEFYSSHHEKSSKVLGPEFGYHTIAISSLESPNITGECGAEEIPGLARRSWVELMKRTWGEDSAQYRVHVLGEFAVNEERKIFSLAMLHEAQRLHGMRNGDEGFTPATGRLWIGLDPAGPGGQGDETAIVWRRGWRALGIFRQRGLTPEGHLVHLLGILAKEAIPGEKLAPVIVYDAGGDVGRDVGRALVEYLDAHRGAFELVKTMGSWPAQRLPQVYVTLRDELAANAERWMRAGGAIPEDVKLERDLHVLEFDQSMKRDARTAAERLTLIKKDGPNGVRTLLGRSPDTGDAFQMCCWEPRRLVEAEASEAAAPDESSLSGFDPYRGIDPYGGQIDPYG